MNRNRSILVLVVVALAVGVWGSVSRTKALHPPTHVAGAGAAGSGESDDSAACARAGSPPYFMMLSPTQSLQVQVVDAAGDPVQGRPVVLRLDGSVAIAAAETAGPGGLATFPQIEHQLRAGRLLHADATATFDV